MRRPLKHASETLARRATETRLDEDFWETVQVRHGRSQTAIFIAVPSCLGNGIHDIWHHHHPLLTPKSTDAQDLGVKRHPVCREPKKALVTD